MAEEKSSGPPLDDKESAPGAQPAPQDLQPDASFALDTGVQSTSKPCWLLVRCF